MNSYTGVSSWKRPSSYNDISATLTIGLVMEARRKIASGRIDVPASASSFPYVSKCTTLSRRATSVIAPAYFPSSMYRCTSRVTFASRLDDIPTDSGVASIATCPVVLVAISLLPRCVLDPLRHLNVTLLPGANDRNARALHAGQYHHGRSRSRVGAAARGTQGRVQLSLQRIGVHR